MVRLRKREKIALGVAGAVVAIILLVVLLFTQTRWGHQRVLAFGLGQLTNRVHGTVRIGAIHGNLLTGARLDHVLITDSSGRPFLRADTLSLRYSLTSLLRQHLVLSDVRLVNAAVVLDKPPGEDWNFYRVFPSAPTAPNQKPGFGSWVQIHNMSVRRVRFEVRTEWAPPDTLHGAARQRAIAAALAPTNRMLVVAVPRGFQTVSQFTNIDGQLPLLRLADPDSANRFIEIASLSMTAMPFRPPAAIVKNLRALVLITNDSLWFDSVRFALPRTRGVGLGAYALNGSGARVQLSLHPLTFEDVRFIDPTLPDGRGTLGLAFTSHNGLTHVIGSNMDVTVEGATVRGLADFQVGPGTFSVGPSNVNFANVDTRLIQRYAPNVPLKTGGTLAGQMRLTGAPTGLRVDGWTTFTERAGPLSRIVADGEVGSSGGGFVARGLRLRFEPLHLSLVRSYAPTLPYRGVITGTATLTGSSKAGFALVADVIDVDPAAGRSHILANGRVQPHNGVTARDLRLRFEPLQVVLIQPFVGEKLPYGGAITGTATLNGATATRMDVNADLVHNAVSTGRSHVLANGGVQLAGGFAARALRLRFDPLQMALIKPFAPSLPYSGTITGTTTLTGSRVAGFAIVADVTHVDPRYGRSRVTANGRVEAAGGLGARALNLGFDPLQVAALRPFVTNLPIDGVFAGKMTVTGSLAAKNLSGTLDMRHIAATGDSHLVGRFGANWRGQGAFDVDVRVPALSLATVGKFVPSAGLKGDASGDIVARGTLANLNTDLNLAFANGAGAMHTVGTFDLSAPLKRYDFTSTLTAFNAGAVMTHVPQTQLTGTVVARGSGTDAATANASLSANLIGSRAAGVPRVDSTIVQARLANGLVMFDRGHIRLGSGVGDITGSFGLVPTQSGTLRYSIVADTLSQFFAHVPMDTGTIYPRPVLQARRIAQARADSARLAEASAVQRAAVGYPPAPSLKVDTLPFRRDTLTGSLRAQGTLTGNIKRFDAQGDAQARNFSAGANHIARGSATYALTGIGTPDASVHLDAFGDTVSLGGFAFDSARALVNYKGQRNTGSGSADIAMYQDPSRDYRVKSDFTLALERKEVALQSLMLRFDTTRWTSTHPSTVGWGKPGITVANLELRSNTGGYLRADGRLPADGSADLQLDIDKLQIGDISGLLQDTGSISGLLGLHARVQGTASAPVISGKATLAQATYGGKPVPDVNATLAYANKDLTAHAELFRATTRLSVADAHLPINLAITGVNGPRLVRTAPLQVDILADSLPFELLPSFTDAVSDVRGRVRGNATVRGTFDKPIMDGLALLDLGSMRVTSSGVLYTDISGAIHLRGDTMYVDSVIAHSGGTVRTSGTLYFKELSRPSFDLVLTADDGPLLLDNEYGHVRANAVLALRGLYTAAVVTGNVNVTGGVFYAPEATTQHVTNLQDPTVIASVDTAAIGFGVVPGLSPLMDNLRADVGVQIGPATWVRNSQANVEVYTPADQDQLRVHMNNRRQRPIITGVINTDRGEYTVAGRNFQLTTGSATFIAGDSIDPLIQLTANYQVQRTGLEPLLIQVHIDGSMTKPRVTLQSNAQPPLAQSDLLSYLAFGQPTSSLLNLQSSSSVGAGGGGLGALSGLAQQQLAGLAIGSMVDQAVSEIERQGTRSGLDVFRVHAGELPAEAQFQSYFRNFFTGTEIEAGKYVTPNIFAEVRGRTSTWPGLSLQYRGPFGLMWNGTWEPRYTPVQPSLSSNQTAGRVRSIGLLLLWTRRF
jgi:translocation and assembly module TamB